MPDRQVPYAAMLRRLAYQRLPPRSSADLLADVREFVDTLAAKVSAREIGRSAPAAASHDGATAGAHRPSIGDMRERRSTETKAALRRTGDGSGVAVVHGSVRGVRQ
jgi:hypothetical protein